MEKLDKKLITKDISGDLLVNMATLNRKLGNGGEVTPIFESLLERREDLQTLVDEVRIVMCRSLEKRGY